VAQVETDLGRKEGRPPALCWLRPTARATFLNHAAGVVVSLVAFRSLLFLLGWVPGAILIMGAAFLVVNQDSPPDVYERWR
jgi:hypothetical protein